MLVSKVFVNPKRYIWKLEKSVELQEKKFFKEFNEKDYCDDILRLYVKDVQTIETEYREKVSTIINELSAEEDENALFEKLETVHPGTHFSNAKKILQDWDREINQLIYPTL
jgi:hypothetical protein